MTFNNVTANHTIAAYFSIDVYTITATASAAVRSPVRAVSVNYGANQSFSITPNTGYHIDSVVVDGVNQGAVASHDFTNVTANHTIAAYFSINVYTITATASAGGSISSVRAVNVNYGANQSFSISPEHRLPHRQRRGGRREPGRGGEPRLHQRDGEPHDRGVFLDQCVSRSRATASAGGHDHARPAL